MKQRRSEALRDRFAAFAKSCGTAIDEAGDVDGADIMTEISRAIDKDLCLSRCILRSAAGCTTQFAPAVRPSTQCACPSAPRICER